MVFPAPGGPTISTFGPVRPAVVVPLPPLHVSLTDLGRIPAAETTDAAPGRTASEREDRHANDHH
jgi:hypothetical protein